jgi:hypothetical protein
VKGAQRRERDIPAECEKEGPKTRKLLMTVTIIAIALTPSIGIGTAHAHGFGGGGFHGGGFGGGGFHGGGVGGRGFDRRGFFNEVFFGGYGGFYPGYYGYGSAPVEPLISAKNSASISARSPISVSRLFQTRAAPARRR